MSDAVLCFLVPALNQNLGMLCMQFFSCCPVFSEIRPDLQWFVSMYMIFGDVVFNDMYDLCWYLMIYHYMYRSMMMKYINLQRYLIICIGLWWTFCNIWFICIDLRGYLMIYIDLWWTLVIFEYMYRSVVIFDYIYRYMVIFGNVWLYVYMYVVIFDYMYRSLVIFDNMHRSVVIFGNIWLHL